eukprot:9497521-Pyramimonas_sp.AAC.1
MTEVGHLHACVCACARVCVSMRGCGCVSDHSFRSSADAVSCRQLCRGKVAPRTSIQSSRALIVDTISADDGLRCLVRMSTDGSGGGWLCTTADVRPRAGHPAADVRHRPAVAAAPAPAD